MAQIDHLLIDRFMEIFVVESKSFRTKIRHANGGWERLNFNHWEGIPCPVEQNERHIAVLAELIKETNLAPTRLGLVLRPKFLNVVVVQPSCSIIGELPDDVRIYRMDKLVRTIRREEPTALDMLRMVSAETIHVLAVDLVAHHKPAPKPSVALREAEPSPKPTPPTAACLLLCQGCGGPLTNAEAHYCRLNNTQVGGRLLCRKCQKQPASPRPSLPQAAHAEQAKAPEEVAARCAKCGGGVDRKVVAFCRFSSKRFGGRILCRTCQGLAQ